jgi:anti-sigma regulatory factor (Ser/Thr protein kinase)
MIAARRNRGFQEKFAAQAADARRVRRLVTDHLNSWGYPEAVEAAALATDELFVNAVRHGSRCASDTVTVTIECDECELLVAVADSSSQLPEQREAALFETGGRGLSIVASIAKTWGTEPAEAGSGKRVWFTMALEAAS